jgi:hypothetical protein
MGNAALAFFSGLGQGYTQGKDNLEKKARQKKLDEREDEDDEHKRKERQRQDDERRALAEAGKTVAVETGAGGMVRPETMDDRDVGLPENQQLPNQGLLPAAYRIGAQTFTDGKAAQTAADAANSPGGRVKRVAAAMYGMGKPGEAMQVEATGRQAELADLQLKTTKDQVSREDVFREVTGQLARGGWSAVPKIYERYEDGRIAEVVEDGKGGATVLAKDKDGKEVGRKVFATMDDFVLSALPNMDPKLWVSESRLARQHKADAGHKSATLAETSRHNQAVEGVYRERNAIAASAERRAAAPAAPAFDPLASFDAKKAQGVAFEQASKEAQEALATGKPMTAQQQAARAQQIYQNTADAFASESTARERARVFKTAARGAKTPEEIEAVRARAAQSGFSDQEMATLDPRFAPKKAAAPAAAQKPIAAAQPKPAAAAGMGAAAAPPPEEAAGQRLDAARAKLRQLRATAPGLAKGRAAIDQHAQAVAAVQDELAAAEAEYQQLMAPQVKPAFVAASRGM